MRGSKVAQDALKLAKKQALAFDATVHVVTSMTRADNSQIDFAAGFVMFYILIFAKYRF